MSRQNVDVVKRLYAAWEKGDFAAELESYDPAVKLAIDYGPDQITASGLDEMRTVWRDQLTLWESWSTGPIQKLVEDGDHVVVGHALRGRSRRGISVEMDDAGAAFTFREGRIVWILATDRMSKALEAVGLHEEPTPPANVEVVRRWIESLGRGDIGSELWHEDLVIDNTVDFPISGPYRGHEGLQRWWDDIAEVVEDLRLAMDEYIDVDGERVLTRNRFIGKMRLTGLDGETKWASVLSVRDGKIARAAGYMSFDEALEVVGLEE